MKPPPQPRPQPSEPIQIGGGGLVAFAAVMSLACVVFFIGYLIVQANKPVLPCKELVAMSRDCIPFGCSKTYVNERGEDTGECR